MRISDWSSDVCSSDLSHGTLEHCERALGNVVLEAKQSQRRTTLAGTVKCRCDDVRYDLLSERTGIHDHRILATCLSDKRDWFIVHRQATGQLLLNKARDLRRTSKDHGCSFRRPHHSCTDRTIARQALQDTWRPEGPRAGKMGVR